MTSFLTMFFGLHGWMMVARFQHSSLMDSWLLRLTARPTALAVKLSNYLK